MIINYKKQTLQMYRTTFAAALLAYAKAESKIVYPGEHVDEIRADWSDYPMFFRKPGGCSATMISDQVALTAAHCISTDEDEGNFSDSTVEMANGDTYKIREYRRNECYYIPHSESKN